MFFVSKEIEIDTAHRLHNHEYECGNIHGHRYRVTLRAGVNKLHTSGNYAGMAIPFEVLKNALLVCVKGPCDHNLILSKDDPICKKFNLNLKKACYCDELETYVHIMDVPPTVENLARYWCEQIAEHWNAHPKTRDFQIHSVKVEETPTCSATYVVR